MAQYSELSESTPLELTDGVDSFRIRSTGNVLQIEKEVASVWTVVDTFSVLSSGDEYFRIGVRSSHFVVDGSYLGMDPYVTEGVDWDNIQQYQL